MKLKKIMKKVSKEILNMSEDEFNKELEKYSDGDIAMTLLREWKRTVSQQSVEVDMDQRPISNQECKIINKFVRDKSKVIHTTKL